MPIFKAGCKLVYYAHVPKCGGSSVAWYLAQRFGPIAFMDNRHTRHDPGMRWSRTSPQHIDRRSLNRLFPPGFFDAVFTIVRHPVARLISAYHFQLEVEGRVSTAIGFSDWLHELPEMMEEDPFLYDNHVRPMSAIVPDGAKVFHMEHGLDGLVPWFDALTGEKAEPRAIPRINERGAHVKVRSGQVQPSDYDLEMIARIYAEDFDRFGYEIGRKMPAAPVPELTPEMIAERDAALGAKADPMRQMSRKIRGKLGI